MKRVEHKGLDAKENTLCRHNANIGSAHNTRSAKQTGPIYTHAHYSLAIMLLAAQQRGTLTCTGPTANTLLGGSNR